MNAVKIEPRSKNSSKDYKTVSFNHLNVDIFPGYNAARYAFYFDGLSKIFPRKNIAYTCKGFPDFHHHCLALKIGSGPLLKLYISVGDGPGYNQNGLKWCNIYAKKTFILEKIPEEYEKIIIPAGPHLETRAWGLLSTILQAIKTYIPGRNCITNTKDHFFRYFQQYYFRYPGKFYFPEEAIENYIFFASTIYPKFPEYNKYRAAFINACKSTPGVLFEGGFIRKDNFRVADYESITIPNYYSREEWITKVKQSTLCFFSHVDQGAIPLKLAEYLACGKAIISMPIRQEALPAPLIHGEHVHYVDGSPKDMSAAIRLLIQDRDYRHKLERNARSYYDHWVAPDQAILRFIQAACERTGTDMANL